MATTASDLIERTRNFLYSGALQEQNRLNGSILSTDTTINLRYALGSLQMRGAIISIDLELIRVWEFSGTSITFADRGVNGTTAATHADGAQVEVLPKFPRSMVLQAINDDLDDLCSPVNGLFQILTLDITYNAAVQGYDMAGVTTPSTVLGIQELRFKEPGPLKRFPQMKDFALVRDMSSTDFTSTLALILKNRGYSGLPVHVRYRSTYTHFVNLTDDAQTVAGLQTYANDLPPLGAAMRLMAPREIKRNFDEAQPDPKLQEDVPPGSVLKSYGGIQLLRQQRIAAVAATLQQQYGIPARIA